MTTNEPNQEAKETVVTRTFRMPAPRPAIQVSDPQVADSLNKKTVGIRQYSDITDIQRLKKQNEMNRDLVRLQQDGLRRAMAGQGLASATGNDAMTTDQVTAGNEAADDHVQIGDTAYNINVGNPEQLKEVLDHLKEITTRNGNGQGQVVQPPQQPQDPVNTFVTQPTTPVQINPVPVQPVSPGPTTTPPAEKSFFEKAMPWLLAAATGLGAAGLTYGLTRPEPGKDTNTTYRLEFDESEAPGQTIPVPKLND